MKWEKILVTGSHGQLGGAFADFLRQHSIPFVTYDRAHPENIPHDVRYVVHFGGLTPRSEESKTKGALEKANVECTAALIRHLAGLKLKRFVNIGSASEYGLSAGIITEKSEERPVNEYGRTKLMQSKLIEAFARKTRVSVVNLRIFNVAIPTRHRTGMLGEILEQFRRHKKIIALPNRKDTRDYVYLDDLMEAIYAALVKKMPTSYEIINIASGKGTSLAEIVALFGADLHRTYALGKDQRASTRSVANVSKSHRLLGWHAKVPIEQMIKEMIARQKRVLVVGAGVAGELVAKELEKDDRQDIIIVGYVDDDPKKKNSEIRGARVLGTVDDIAQLVMNGAVDQILVSTPSVGGLVQRVTAMVPAGFPIKVLPSISSVILGQVDLSYVRDIDPSDLIGRPLVKTDQVLISKKVRGRRFLVTGGAGSIGSEIVRQLYSSGAKEIIIFDSWEEGTFNIMEELHSAIRSAPYVRVVIGNIRDFDRLEEVIRTRPDVVFHAAAYKHVPLMEANAGEAHKTNEIGTKNILDLVVKYGVKEFVLISTDKAVNPMSVMGKTKRAAELMMKTYAKKHKGISFCAVRFGNVLNSSGSVLPKFLRQIRMREPVTVTHKDMTRYFMSIPEAVSLVLMAWVIGKSGQILLLDMGAPIRVLSLAETLIKLHGLIPYVDIPIIETGMRPGEKIHEELSYDPQKLRPSPAKRIFIAEDIK